MIDGIPVYEAVAHAYNIDESNFGRKYARPIAEATFAAIQRGSKPGYVPTHEQYMRDWSAEDMANMLFLESDTDLATYHVLALNAFTDGMCSVAKAVEVNERWPNRFLTYAGVDPLTGQAALDELERQVELLNPIGLKLYPNSWLGDEVTGWLMDDPEVAFPLFERARQLGIKVIAVHKAVPLGPVPLEHYRVDDIDRAAAAFPDLNFEVVHGGMAFLEESGWQMKRFPNVYVNLELTTSLVEMRPLAFEQAMATFLSAGGPRALDRIMWGTGAMGIHPRPLIEYFIRSFQIRDELVEGLAIPQITLDAKRKIMWDNYAAMTGVDLDARLQRVGNDEFAQRRAADGLAEPYSTTGLVGAPL